MAFTVANVDERDVVPNLYDKVLLIGDKGFISGELRVCSQRGRAGRCFPGCYFEVNEG